MDDMNRAVSLKMANMGYVCACLVVLIHCTPPSETGSLFWWFSHLFCRDGICIVAVPYFFFAAGVFLMRHIGEQGWWRWAIAKRVRSLVIPFFVWMAVYQLFEMTLRYAKGQGLTWFNGLPWWEWTVRFMGVHPFLDIGVFWFLRCLFALMLFSPMLVRGLKYKRAMLIGIALAYLAFQFYMGAFGSWNAYSLFDRFITLRGLLWFSVGMCFVDQIAQIAFSRHWRLCVFVGLLLLVAKSLFCVKGVFAVEWVMEACAVPFLMMGVLGGIPSVSWPRWLVGNTFAIYLIHNIFLSTAALILTIAGVYGKSAFAPLIMLFRLVFAILMSTMAAEMLRKWFPAVARVCFGGR